MNRAGAALVLALLILLVLEGVVLGTVYLTVQERRVANNGVVALRLRLAAESAARRAAGVWPAELDSLARGALSRDIVATDADGLALRTVYQRIDSTLVLVFAEAGEPPPRAGRARAALLVQPPLLPARLLPNAALTAGANVTLGPVAVLASSSTTYCPDANEGGLPVDALRLPDMGLLVRMPGAAVGGAITATALDAAWAARIAAVAGIQQFTATVVESRVIAVTGDLTIPVNAAVRGVLLVDGALRVEAGAVVEGLVVVTGPVEVHGTVRFSGCVVRESIHSTGLHRPRAHPTRAAVPAF